jgi:hypothetical protein
MEAPGHRFAVEKAGSGAMDEPTESRELAVMVEQVRMTALGVISAGLLFLTVIGTAFLYVEAKTVFQQMLAGEALVCGLLLFGLGTALGRKRTYHIYRSQHREPL